MVETATPVTWPESRTVEDAREPPPVLPMNGYAPPIYVQVLMQMAFDAAEAQRRRDTYEAQRAEYTRLWREYEQRREAAKA